MKRLRFPRLRLPRRREALLATLLLGVLGFGSQLNLGTGETSDSSVFAAETAAPVSEEPANTAADETSGVFYNENAGGGGAKNVVRLINRQDQRLRVKGSIQLNQIPAPNVAPANLALAYGSCNGCQTFSVALQINLISRDASRVVPENAAVALNYQCTACTTVAHAIQYVITVDNPTAVPQDVRELIRDMDRELKALHSDGSVTLPEASARVDAVIARFKTLATDLQQVREQTTDVTTPGATAQP
jgi:hypothetical protein